MFACARRFATFLPQLGAKKSLSVLHPRAMPTEEEVAAARRLRSVLDAQRRLARSLQQLRAAQAVREQQREQQRERREMALEDRDVR